MTDFPDPPRPPEWATYIPHRTTKGKFVVHNTQGHAKAAIANGCEMSSYRSDRRNAEDMQLLHWNGTEWVVEHLIPVGTRAKDLPWRKK